MFQMSIRSSSLIVLLVLLCCSLHAWSARSLRVLRKESTSAKESNSKQQKSMISDPTRVSLPSEMKSSSPIITSKISDRFSPQPGNKIQSELDNKSSRNNNAPNKGNKIKADSSTKKNKQRHRRTSQQATVSWRVPHKKRGEKDAGFNLDYLPPRTHPPAHN